MEFLKTFNTSHRGKRSCLASLVIDNSNSQLRIRIYDKTMFFDTVGIIENGLGVVLKKRSTDSTDITTKYILRKIHFTESDIPVNLQATGYTFEIEGVKKSDTEYVFCWKDAKMVK